MAYRLTVSALLAVLAGCTPGHDGPTVRFAPVETMAVPFIAPPIATADPVLAELLLRPESFRGWNRALSPGSVAIMTENLGAPGLRLHAEAQLAAAAAWRDTLAELGVGPTRLAIAAALCEAAAGRLGLTLLSRPADPEPALDRYRAGFLASHRLAGIAPDQLVVAAAAAALAVEQQLGTEAGPEAAAMREAASALRRSALELPVMPGAAAWYMAGGGRASLDHTEGAGLDHRALPAGRDVERAARGPGAARARPGLRSGVAVYPVR